MLVARSFSGGVAIANVLPVLWMNDVIYHGLRGSASPALICYNTSHLATYFTIIGVVYATRGGCLLKVSYKETECLQLR